ncbi:hypothetical protein P692DRAFT_20761134 [Suillus brevipes Sb2]|nr:hypothetical protein P692DRAFT_20761134 [Suillus brevipes Sb2]
MQRLRIFREAKNPKRCLCLSCLFTPFTIHSDNSLCWYRSSGADSDSKSAPLRQLDTTPVTPDAVTDLQRRLEVAEKNCSHYFELYKKYRLRWLEENHRADILERYAPPNVNCYSSAQLQWDAPSPCLLLGEVSN